MLQSFFLKIVFSKRGTYIVSFLSYSWLDYSTILDGSYYTLYLIFLRKDFEMTLNLGGTVKNCTKLFKQ